MFKFQSHADMSYWLKWDAGTITGSPAALPLFEEETFETVCLPPVGPCLTYDKNDPASVLIAFNLVLGTGVIIMGTEPELDLDIPDDAIA